VPTRVFRVAAAAQTIDDAVGPDGTTYRQLPMAYAYQTSIDPACASPRTGAQTVSIMKDFTLRAGDTVVATLASAMGAGMSLHEATQLSNLAAGLAVAKVGTAAVTMDELWGLISTASMPLATKQNDKGGPFQSGQKTDHKVVSQNDLREQVLSLKQEGKTVVMTNGCFDILHPGHVSYLESARALGDVLVVALNSDSSVRTLKGEGRPVNPLESRLRMLGALSCVDLVTAFDEETPESLISRLLPSILVKGGDYTAEQIAGGVQVQESGGTVMVLDFLEGHSTSTLIEKIKASK
jgi:D-beta-D-heptose 7-phosphate kinase/D-beta-D-heptose 1-phosphate adenosyltransferase